MLSLNDVSAGPKDMPLWRDVSLQVQRGEVHIIHGVTGSGKTTLLRCIAGLHAISCGTVSWDNEVMSSAQHTTPPWTRNVGMAFQDSALWPHLTIKQHLKLTTKSSQHKARDLRLNEDEIVERMQLAAFLHKKPSNLSGGQRQRASIARAIASQADLLLLDEPLAHQDPGSSAEVASFLNALASHYKRALLVVTHDARDLTQYSHSTSRLVKGTLLTETLPAPIQSSHA
jgi:iron(III) transport system ATP-binding protein